MIKLLCVIGQLGNGGTERQLFLFLKHLDRSKYCPIVVVSGTADGIWNQRLKELNIDIIALGSVHPVVKLIKFRYLIFRHKVDVVFSWSFFTNTFSMVCGKARFIGSLRQQFSYVKTELSPSRVKSCLNVSKMVVNSKYMQKELLDEGFEETDIEVVHNIFEAFKDENSVDKQQLRQTLKLPEDKKLIIGVGRDSPSKNFPFFVNVIDAVLKETPNCHAILVGSGGLAVTELIAEKGLTDAFTLTGEVPDARPYMNAADIFFLSSISEGFANVLTEAFDCQCACVAADVGGACDLVDQGESGFIIEKNNQQEAVAKLTTLLQSQDLISLFNRNAREKLKQFTVQESMSRYCKHL